MSVSAYNSGDMAQLDGVLDTSWRELEASIENVEGVPEPHRSHFARTLWLEERPVACFGVWPLQAGVGRAWSILTEQAIAHPMALYRGVLRQLVAFERDEELIRVESVVKVGHPTAHEWIQHLGFERETMDCGMRCYGLEGETYHLYARVRSL